VHLMAAAYVQWAQVLRPYLYSDARAVTQQR
jgi:hypothetical protein